jgi:hypothetical protein
MFWVRIPFLAMVFSSTTLCDKVCQWLATGQWFSLSTPVSSTNKTGRHDVNEILLKVALNLINQSKSSIFWISFCCTWCTLFQKRVVRTKLYNLHFYSTFLGGFQTNLNFITGQNQYWFSSGTWHDGIGKQVVLTSTIQWEQLLLIWNAYGQQTVLRYTSYEWCVVYDVFLSNVVMSHAQKVWKLE